MLKIIKKTLPVIALAAVAFAIDAAPAFANANTKVLCGYEAQTSATTRMGIYYVVDMTESSPNPVLYNDDQYHNEVCDTALDKISANLSKDLTWYKQRKETTWADRCNDSDPVAMYFGKTGSSCVNYVKGKVNIATGNQATPHDLLSCMNVNRTYRVDFDGAQRTYYDMVDPKNPKKLVDIPLAQLNCVSPIQP